jgi:hypothetical protein
MPKLKKTKRLSIRFDWVDWGAWRLGSKPDGSVVFVKTSKSQGRFLQSLQTRPVLWIPEPFQGKIPTQKNWENHTNEPGAEPTFRTSKSLESFFPYESVIDS